jgi:hypothetical protein
MDSSLMIQRPALSDAELKHLAPAIFAEAPEEHRSRAYRFISTAQVLAGLRAAGFAPVAARQVATRSASLQHARHLVRFRIPEEPVTLGDAWPELVLLNSHDGTSAYELRAGLYRPVCTNGLVVALGDFVALRVAHRGNVIEQVVEAARAVAGRFSAIRLEVGRMVATVLEEGARLAFAEEALTLRYGPEERGSLMPRQLLAIRRVGDAGEDLWHTFNVIQGNLVQGGLLRRTSTGRLTRTRRLRAIREDLRINAGLWAIARRYLGH